MSLMDVARKDFLDVLRAKVVWGPIVLYTLFTILLFWGMSQVPTPDFSRVILFMAFLGGVVLIPLAALVAAYLCIAGERESGSIKYALSLPVSRSALVFGKFLSRSAIVVGGILVAFAVGIPAAFVFVPHMTFLYGDYVLFTGLTILYTLAYVSIAVALSAATGSRSRAMGASVAFFIVFNIAWHFLPIRPSQVVTFLADQIGVTVSDSITTFIFSLSPAGSYLRGLQLILPSKVIAAQGGGTISNGPFYVQGWFMLVLLALWVIVPLALGYRRFTRADLA